MFNRSRKKIIVSIMGSLILLFSVTLSVILFASFREVRKRNRDMLEHYAELYSLEQQPDGQNRPVPENGGPYKPDLPAAEGSLPSAEGSLPSAESSLPSDQGSLPPAEGSLPAAEGSFPSAEGSLPSAESSLPLDQGSLPPDKGGPPIDQRPDYQLSTFYSVALSEDGSVLAVDKGNKAVYDEKDLTELAESILEGKASSGRIDSLFYIVSRRDGYTLVAFMDNTVSEGGLNTLLRYVLIVGGVSIVLLFFISLYLSGRIIRPLEENDRQQKQFISDAGHELKTPVAVIGTNAEMLSRELGENEWLSNIQYENERMGDLVKQLLDLSRAENTEPPVETVDFSRVVTGEVLAFESIAFEQGKMIRSGIADGILLSGSQTQLTQLVSVLLDNAIRHGDGGEIEVSLNHQGHAAVLSVTNEGAEIPPEKREHLFDRFYRLDEARNSQGHHYGLGLSIAKAVAEKHGGNIDVSCHGGKVSFSVSLPVR